MKKTLCTFFLTLVFCLGICSCKKDEKKSGQNPSQASAESVGVVSNYTEPTQKDGQPEEFKEGYSVTPHTYLHGKISLTHPEISGLKDSSLQEECNRILSHSILDRVEYYHPNDSLSAEFRVTYATEEIVSILTTGQISPDGAARPYYFYQSLNIDLVHGKIIRLNDIADIDEYASNFADDWVLSTPIDRRDRAAQELCSLTYTERFKLLEECDVQEGELYSPGYSYIENGKIYMLLPVSHALGDYALCVMP